MNAIETAARKFAPQFDIDEEGFVDMESERKTMNNIFDYVCETFYRRLPPERLLSKHCQRFSEGAMGSWNGRDNKSERTMQTIFDRAFDIAKARQ